VEQFFLPQMNIERCRQCEDNGWGICRTEGQCVIEDDFAALVDGIRDADAVVFATPVYWGDLSESIRAFLDRLRRICTHEDGKSGIGGTKAIGICVAGGGGGDGPSCAVNMEKILHTCGFDLLDMVPARRQNLEMKCRVLKMTGEWLASV
jgi:multimeric flavodoxin WrbA